MGFTMNNDVINSKSDIKKGVVLLYVSLRASISLQWWSQKRNYFVLILIFEWEGNILKAIIVGLLEEIQSYNMIVLPVGFFPFMP